MITRDGTDVAICETDIPQRLIKWGSCCSILSFMCNVLCILLSFFFWPLCCLSLLALWLLVTPQVYSNIFLPCYTQPSVKEILISRNHKFLNNVPAKIHILHVQELLSQLSPFLPQTITYQPRYIYSMCRSCYHSPHHSSHTQ